MVEQRLVYDKKDVEEARQFAAENSPCIRRKYGALIIDSVGNRVLSTNYRLGKYCHDEFCVRDYCKVPHGEKTELGGEIHAEQAALVDYSRPSLGPNEYKHILVAGLDHKGEPLVGMDNSPCHVCAMMIKFAGFKYVWMPFQEGNPLPISIDEILEYYEVLV